MTVCKNEQDMISQALMTPQEFLLFAEFKIELLKKRIARVKIIGEYDHEKPIVHMQGEIEAYTDIAFELKKIITVLKKDDLFWEEQSND